MKIGDYVYTIDNYGTYREGTIIDITTYQNKTYATINMNPGIQGFPINKIFKTAKLRDIQVAHQKKIQISEYKKQMPTMKDIVLFCLDHCIANGEEYTDWEARAAVEERLEELTKS